MTVHTDKDEEEEGDAAGWWWGAEKERRTGEGEKEIRQGGLSDSAAAA